jgi:hypothetical protein
MLAIRKPIETMLRVLRSSASVTDAIGTPASTGLSRYFVPRAGIEPHAALAAQDFKGCAARKFLKQNERFFSECAKGSADSMLRDRRVSVIEALGFVAVLGLR